MLNLNDISLGEYNQNVSNLIYLIYLICLYLYLYFYNQILSQL